jgi:hypothetical protein
VAIARFKDLCVDAGDPGLLGSFWAAVTGPTPQHTIWVNPVPEAKAVKHRVHLDIYGEFGAFTP